MSRMIDKNALEIISNIYEGAYVADSSGRIEFWNDSAQRITGYSSTEVLGARCRDNILVHIDSTGKYLCGEDCPIRGALSGGVYEAEAYLRHKYGYRVPVRIRTFPLKSASGKIKKIIEIFTEKQPAAECGSVIEGLREQAVRDPLTGLYNRRFLEEQLKIKLGEVRRYGARTGLLFLDLEKFKSVNDRFGHITGDRLLKAVSMTLLKNSRSSDIAGRWGGDEFMIIIPGADRKALDMASAKLASLVRNTCVKSGSERVSAGVSAGGTLINKNDTRASLLKRADRLMYADKKKTGRKETEGEDVKKNNKD